MWTRKIKNKENTSLLLNTLCLYNLHNVKDGIQEETKHLVPRV